MANISQVFVFLQRGSEMEKVWTKEEILKLWPQAEGELTGFYRVLKANAGITASQLGMALQLAKAEFDRIKNES